MSMIMIMMMMMSERVTLQRERRQADCPRHVAQQPRMAPPTMVHSLTAETPSVDHY